MKTNIFQLILVLFFLYSIPVGAQEEINITEPDNSSPEANTINSLILHKAYIYRTRNFSTLTGKNIPLSSKYGIPRIYFDRDGKVRKLIHNGYFGEIYISYFDDDGYLRFMVSRDYDKGLGLTSIIYANNNRIIDADYAGYKEDYGIDNNISLNQSEGKNLERKNGFPEEAFVHVDSIKSYYNISLDPPADTEIITFEHLLDNLPKFINREELPEKKKRKDPENWQVKYFGNAKNISPDKDKLMTCYNEVKKINEMPLTKLYEVIDRNVFSSWEIFSGDSIINDINDSGDAHNVYIDTGGKLRKYIRNSYENAENTSNLTAYYDEDGYLLKLICNNVLYDTIYTFGEKELEYYDIKYANIYGSISCLNGKILMQTYNRMDFYNDYIPVKYSGTGTELLSSIGLIDITKTHHTDSLLNFLGINPADFNLLAGTPICFQGERLRSLKLINSQHVPIRSAPINTARIQDTVDAGLVANIVEKMHAQYLEDYGTHFWYKVTFGISTNYNYQPGYIFGAFLEPGESIYIKQRKTWRRSSY